ncbi:MAG: hypothetical protein GY710_17070 [Desulfobacteraceae bacterium]|nr:hypothetical protein [Desulfobacteraceae bacterium]
MIQEKPLSIADITQELNSGPATIKFILKRFSPWLPFERIDGHHNYSRKTIPILIKIKEFIDTGMLPSQIDQELKAGIQASPETKTDTKPDNYFLEQPNEDIRVSKDGLSLIKSLFDDIAIQQNRVANAHEKRAQVEERKAIAIEKRAGAEEKKAMAMNNIATALQEMNHHRIHDSQTREMAFQAAQVLAIDETNQDIDPPEFNDIEQLDIAEEFNLSDPHLDLLETSEIKMDDLADLIKDDISSEEPEGIEDQRLERKVELDDLTVLIDQNHTQPDSRTKPIDTLDIDDLSKLLDDPAPPPENLDNLSTLVDTASTHTVLEAVPLLDNLSLLVDDIAPPQTPLDNLSLLIKSPITQPQDLVEKDDLSLLITPESLAPMDDLTVLISEPPSLKIEIKPEENLKEYKAAVMKIILGLKTKGVSAKESTKRLNQDGIQTISGKSKWSEKAMSQIYNFIDSAK